MDSETLVLRAAAGDTAALQVLLVAEQPFILRAARRFAAWCHDDVAQTANACVLTGFRSFKLSGQVGPWSAWRRWLLTLVRNTAWRESKRLARGSAQAIADSAAVICKQQASVSSDMEAAYEAVLHAALECMPLGARFAWLAQQQKVSAKRLGEKLGLRGDRGAHYHIQVARKLVHELATTLGAA